MLASPSIYNHHSQSILIVDDNEMLLELLTEGFEMFGFNVLKADNGLDAGNLLNSEQVEIVLIDIQMPGFDGIELSKRIRKQSPNMAIALMTGGNTDTTEELLRMGQGTIFSRSLSLGAMFASISRQRRRGCDPPPLVCIDRRGRHQKGYRGHANV